MKRIHVPASREYDVLIGSDLHQHAGEFLLQIHKPCKTALISDSNVWPIYGHIITEALNSAGFETFPFIIPAGEASKNFAMYGQILNFLSTHQITRSDCVIALGGGVVGDITGFSAATYLRGIPYIQIPTTLLAMVDSSVGGKTAIDLPTGKNLAGAFYQPSLVLCDTDSLDTLPEQIFQDGCAEVIKYGVLYDSNLFAHLTEFGTSFYREQVISKCVELKRDVVIADEFDKGERQKLNLGHTIGHSVESLSNFTISHGQAVAIGMNIIAKAAAYFNICSNETYAQIKEITDLFHLPTNTAFSSDAIFSAALSDKKRAGGTVNMIVPTEVGNCIIQPVDIDQLQSFIKAGL